MTSEQVKELVARLNTSFQSEESAQQQQEKGTPSQNTGGPGNSPPPQPPTGKRPKRITKAIHHIETKLLPKLEKYEQQEHVLAGRNSYSRTDTGATVFRMKDGQLLPGYNILFGTQRQFIVNYSLYQKKASETDALIAHLKHGHKLLTRFPELVMGDSAFGSEENYAFLAQQQIDNYLKYNTFHLENTNKYLANPYRKENFGYDRTTDTYCCPQGQTLTFKETREVTTDNGYTTRLKIYRCINCDRCPVAALCKRGAGNRSIQINPTLDAYRAQARVNLTSERGMALRKQRGVDVEPPLGDIKFNQGYNRCRLRGEEKVKVELGILSIAHNAKKVAQLSTRQFITACK